MGLKTDEELALFTIMPRDVAKRLDEQERLRKACLEVAAFLEMPKPEDPTWAGMLTTRLEALDMLISHCMFGKPRPPF